MKIKSIMLFIAPLLLAGCVNTQYQKSVSVTKDANGNIVSRTETESVMQPNQQGWPVKFEYLKGVQPGESK
jgi:PBP1b-binding outer membrane lipoprotein LpoB